MAQISASVGSYESGARNQTQDVNTVQTLLTQAARNLTNPAFNPGGVDGKIARVGALSGTVKAITQFQRLRVGMARPDQRIDVGGGTWHALVAAAGPMMPAAPPRLVSAITLTVQHGGKFPTQTVRKGNLKATYDGMYESTFILSGGMTGTFRGSIWPDDMTVRGHLKDATYPLHIGFHKGGSAARQGASDLVARTEGIRVGLLVNARNSVNVQSDNAGKTTAQGINVHNGFNSKRFSDGCLTLQPTDWLRFIQLFLDAFPSIDDWHTVGNNTGKQVGQLVIKA